MKKITDLIEDALNYSDYDRRINFLIAGLISADANDTPEKEAVNMEYLREIFKYCIDYRGEQTDYIKSIEDIINPYISRGK